MITRLLGLVVGPVTGPVELGFTRDRLHPVTFRDPLKLDDFILVNTGTDGSNFGPRASEIFFHAHAHFAGGTFALPNGDTTTLSDWDLIVAGRTGSGARAVCQVVNCRQEGLFFEDGRSALRLPDGNFLFELGLMTL